jgi:hypothetical protein
VLVDNPVGHQFAFGADLVQEMKNHPVSQQRDSYGQDDGRQYDKTIVKSRDNRFSIHRMSLSIK